VVVYSVVAVLLWPRPGAAAFEDAVRSVCAGQRELFRLYLGALTGAPDEEGAGRLRARLAGQAAGLGARLEGAIFDSDAIWEVREAWRRCLRDSEALSRAMERWRSGFTELQDTDLEALLPDLRAFGAEIEWRLAAAESGLAGERPQRRARDVSLPLDEEASRALSHFQRAALVLCRDQLRGIEALTRALLDDVREIRDDGRPERPPDPTAAPQQGTVIDLDRLAVTVRQSVALWLTLLMTIYVPDVPIAVGLIALANAFAMFLALVPHVQPRVFFLPTVCGSCFAGALYLLVMPHLSGFGALGVMIFAATFVIAYAFHRPQSALAKVMGLTTLVIFIGVENGQSYSFLYFANWLTVMVAFVCVLVAAWQFPIHFWPQGRFVSTLRRFFRSAQFLLSPSRAACGPGESSLSRWRRAFHLHQVTVLPQRLRAWGGALPPEALGHSGGGQMQALLAGVQVLSDRVQALIELRRTLHAPADGVAVPGWVTDWCAGVEEALAKLAVDPGSVDRDAFRARLDAIVARIESAVEDDINAAGGARPSPEEGDSVFRLMGAYRSLSEAMVDVAGQVVPVDWARLGEARF
jgi:hypothetical protein